MTTKCPICNSLHIDCECPYACEHAGIEFHRDAQYTGNPVRIDRGEFSVKTGEQQDIGSDEESLLYRKPSPYRSL